ncbi:hypothetical protein Back2_08550 [Nocardioides baekrokdamisoli]|uniref:Adenylate cyclase n=1 Tax=Nocardioides baekrokdamisoli TaxID=1804624 RepID=A0A3G9IZ03_9ACTN|nr:adenylate/guanylate cyclase domain-containing protein [Nocardioides baekrokdamisoli]BBH16568.1 hypothetical protein Back2_08550 [Nocardioides baekrokdamisoli]
MRLRLVRWVFRRFAHQYWLIHALAEGIFSAQVAIVTVCLAALYFRPGWADLLDVVVVAVALTIVPITFVALCSRGPIGRFLQWRSNPDATEAETVALWHELVGLTWSTFRSYSLFINLSAVIPAVAVAALLWHIGWPGFAAMLLATAVPSYYATVVTYTIGELLTVPVIEEIADRLPPTFEIGDHGISIASRLKVALPAYTIAAAMATASLVGHQRGAGAMAITVLVSGAVGVFLATELTVLLGDSITKPVRGMRAQVDRVQEGDYAARTPVLRSDELGVLAHEINAMSRGLAEREEIRNAFGTYMDKSVVELILSGQFPPEGVEVTASMLFCDVRGFTSYAEGASAPQVIAALNEMFSAIVPIVERHGGHVDKFLGDGLLAVFGTPDEFLDHADKAVAAACEIALADTLGSVGLTVGVGVNTGQVVAGPLGGAGRLNFSVIGDAVNVAARVEAATRQTGDAVLITDATRLMLSKAYELDSRGEIELKGKAEPLQLFAPKLLVRDAPG